MNDQSVRIYTPESQLKNPSLLFKEMSSDLLASRELAWRLLVRDISAQYRQSFLGVFWVFSGCFLGVYTACGDGRRFIDGAQCQCH